MPVLDDLRNARDLHEQVMENHSPDTARRIVDLLSSVERLLLGNYRAENLLLWLRTDAEFWAGLTDSPGVKHPNQVTAHYEEIEDMLLDRRVKKKRK